MSSMPLQDKNKVIIACAGSGKTSYLVEQAIKNKERTLLLTYTNENLANIQKVFIEKNNFTPSNITIKSWFTFLLGDCVRPYHNHVSAGPRVASINFIQGSSASIKALRSIPMSNTERYFFDKERRIYTDKISLYAYACNLKSKGLVIARLEELYDSIFIDEIQDLAGWDLELLKLLFDSKIKVILVGDPRQVTYSTNHSSKNSQYRDEKIVTFFQDLEKLNKCKVIYKVDCHRCNQDICNLADSIYPTLSKSTSLNTEITGHDGIFQINTDEVENYIIQHKPVLLRYRSDSNTLGYKARNFGITKGLTFDRVLIFPTKPMKEFLQTKNPDDIGDKAKFYVAVTRARYSVTFVV